MFELFGDSFLAGDDSEPALEADVPPDLGQEQASQSRPESAGFMGLVANRIRSARPFGRSEDSTPSEEVRHLLGASLLGASLLWNIRDALNGLAHESHV